MPSSDGKTYRHLIGILSQLDNNEYQFEYCLNDNSPESHNLLLPIFPNKYKIYNNTDTRILLDDYLPSENDTAFISYILKKTKMNKYSEWAWLCAFESDNPDAETILYETLPDDIIRHDLTCQDDIIDFDTEIPDVDTDINDEFDDDVTEISDDIDINNDDDDDDEIFPDFDDIPDIDASDENNIISNAVFIDKAVPAFSGAAYNQKPVPKNVVRKITKKTIQKRKRQNSIDDFIEPAPESPIDRIQQRLLENQKTRQQALAEKIKQNNR